MDWGYVAGFFDGEGSVRLKAAPSRPNYALTGLSWANNNLESLEAIQAFIEAGHIQIRKKRGMMTKEAYQLNISKVEELIRVGEMMLPHLIIKRERMQKMLDFVRENRKPQSSAWGVLVAIGVDEIKRLYFDEGMTQSQIADKIGCSRGAVSSYFIVNEITGRRTGPADGAYGILVSHGKEKLFAMYESGMTYKQIAEQLGVRYGTVSNYFWREGKVKLTRKIRKARRENNG